MRGNTSLRVRRLFMPAILLTAFSPVSPMALYAQEEKEKPADDMAYTWTFKYKKGDKYRIKAKAEMKFSVSGNEFPLEIASTTKHEVKEVADNGDVTTVETTEDVKISVAGQE